MELSVPILAWTATALTAVAFACASMKGNTRSDEMNFLDRAMPRKDFFLEKLVIRWLLRSEKSPVEMQRAAQFIRTPTVLLLNLQQQFHREQLLKNKFEIEGRISAEHLLSRTIRGELKTSRTNLRQLARLKKLFPTRHQIIDALKLENSKRDVLIEKLRAASTREKCLADQLRDLDLNLTNTEIKCVAAQTKLTLHDSKVASEKALSVLTAWETKLDIKNHKIKHRIPQSGDGKVLNNSRAVLDKYEEQVLERERHAFKSTSSKRRAEKNQWLIRHQLQLSRLSSRVRSNFWSVVNRVQNTVHVLDPDLDRSFLRLNNRVKMTREALAGCQAAEKKLQSELANFERDYPEGSVPNSLETSTLRISGLSEADLKTRLESQRASSARVEQSVFRLEFIYQRLRIMRILLKGLIGNNKQETWQLLKLIKQAREYFEGNSKLKLEGLAERLSTFEYTLLSAHIQRAKTMKEFAHKIDTSEFLKVVSSVSFELEQELERALLEIQKWQVRQTTAESEIQTELANSAEIKSAQATEEISIAKSREVETSKTVKLINQAMEVMQLSATICEAASNEIGGLA